MPLQTIEPPTMVKTIRVQIGKDWIRRDFPRPVEMSVARDRAQYLLDVLTNIANPRTSESGR